MKSLIRILSVLLVSLVAGAEPKGQGPAMPPALVAKTVAWQGHWDNRAGKPVKLPATAAFKVRNQSDVWITGLDWIITFVYKGSQPFPHDVQRLLPPSSEVRQQMLEPFAGLPLVTVKVPTYADSFRKLSTLQAESRSKLLDAIKQEACTTNLLSFYRHQIGKPIVTIRFWIAPVDLDFPVILYAVEGVPYIGRVDFDTHSLKPLYSDFDYIGDEGTEPHKQGLRLINAIKQEGDRFELRNGGLVPAVR